MYKKLVIYLHKILPGIKKIILIENAIILIVNKNWLKKNYIYIKYKCFILYERFIRYLVYRLSRKN